MKIVAKISFLLLALILYGTTAQAKESHESIEVEIEKDAAEGIALIAERMKSLSNGLERMAEPPRLNQTIELPLLPEAHASGEDQES